MKKYFEKHKLELNKTQPKPQELTQNDTQPKFEVSRLFASAKPNKTTSFFKSKDIPKILTQLKPSTNIPKLPITPITNKQPTKRIHPETQTYSFNQTIRQQRQPVEQQCIIKQRGFSLQYLKMTKRHKVKQMLSLNQLNENSKAIRSRTLFESAFSKRSQEGKKSQRSGDEVKLLMSLSQGQEIKKNIELNKTFNSFKLPKTTTFYNKKKKLNSLLAKFAQAQHILLQNPVTSSVNTPTPFIPIQMVLIEADRKFFGGKHITSQKEMNKTLLRKSKYSPFKSRNGSSASHNEDLRDVKTKEFGDENDFRNDQRLGLKDVGKYKQSRHKRIKTLGNANQRRQSQHYNDMQSQPNLLSLNDSMHTTRVLSQGLYGNIKLLNDLRRCFQSVDHQNKTGDIPLKKTVDISLKKSSDIPLTKISQLMKVYVFGQKQTQKQKHYKNLLFPQIDSIFQSQQQRAIIRKIVCCQRLLMICIVDLLSHQKLANLFQQIKLTIITLLVIYLIVFKQAQQLQAYYHMDQEVTQYIQSLLKIPQLKSLSPISKHLGGSLLPYIDNLFRYSKELYQKEFKLLLEDSRTRTINRTFYQLLKKYAIYLTNNQQRITHKHNSSSNNKSTVVSAQLIASFATCPAPYILSKPQKRYTLCVDLDETLLYSSFTCNKKFDTVYRPGAKQFVIQLNKYYEIVVFTSSVKEYADQVIKPFGQFVDHILYRYHVTRGRNLTNTVKDLSRVGRKLEKVIFVDDLQCNAKLQPENSIKVTPWKGDTRDREILELKGLLLALGKEEEQREDVRKAVAEIKEKLKNHNLKKE